ncbi:unnamed protein product [Meloidogyne enterolobii]|uniref:Uncharacterized protein n=1 Tax=Meloidogyne enterolobii TaxID=390850 RepID=A0ACB0Y376_MELEN
MFISGIPCYLLSLKPLHVSRSFPESSHISLSFQVILSICLSIKLLASGKFHLKIFDLPFIAAQILSKHLLPQLRTLLFSFKYIDRFIKLPLTLVLLFFQFAGSLCHS